MKRRHYDPAATVSPAPVAPSDTASVKLRTYQWYDDGQREWNWRHIQLRKWIANRVDSAAGLRQLAADMFGKSYHLDLGGSVENAAHALVREAENHNMLSMLATLVEFELQPQQPTASAFSQTRQTVYNTQINTSVGAVVGGNVIIGDKIVRR